MLLLLSVALAQDLVVGPFLQDATPTSVWVVWETSSGDDGEVRWGVADPAYAVAATSHVGEGASRVHEARIDGLSPGQRYVYEVQTGAVTSATYAFVAPSARGDEVPTRLVAMSDMQRDRSNPDKYREVIEDGVIPWATATWDPDLARAIDLVMVPGDLVEDGLDYAQWADDFFGPGAELMASVPFYPVLGNHEHDADAYFSYFHLPDNGTEGFEEHWWWADHGNVRIIGLDSNVQYWSEAQRVWLDDVLTDACGDPFVDFVFAQLHHPYHSEVWLAGETPFTGLIVEQLQDFSDECGKPSVHFFGHTHAYSRGVARDHQHLMVNVATAGGAIDQWGSSAQEDYPEFAVSTADWGFVAVEATAGNDPTVTVTRLSRGSALDPLDNEQTDQVRIRRFPEPPAAPVPAWPDAAIASADCFVLRTEPFHDPDGGAHQATHWQIAASSTDFDAPLWEAWRQDRNVFQGVDRAAFDDLTEARVDHLAEGRALAWRVRFRDSDLAWSAWSEPVAFEVGAFTTSEDLVRDGGIEAGNTWIGGRRAQVGDCGLTRVPEGTHALAVGCDDASAFQRIALTAGAGGFLRVEAWVHDGAVLDAVFHDDAGELATERIAAATGPWASRVGVVPIPDGAVAVDLLATGVGAIDGVIARQSAVEEPSCAVVAGAADPAGCGCSDSGAAPSWPAALVLLLVPTARRPRARAAG